MVERSDSYRTLVRVISRDEDDVEFGVEKKNLNCVLMQKIMTKMMTKMKKACMRKNSCLASWARSVAA